MTDYGVCLSATAAPQVESEQREHSVEKGETLKVKIPFQGTGPFSFKLKKGSREIPDSDRVKLIPFEDYVILQIKGLAAITFLHRSFNRREIIEAYHACACQITIAIYLLTVGQTPT